MTETAAETRREEVRQMLQRRATEIRLRYAAGTPVADDAVRTLLEAADAVHGLGGGEMTHDRVQRAIAHDPLLYAVYNLGAQHERARTP